jgi:hypothetical protein
MSPSISALGGCIAAEVLLGACTLGRMVDLGHNLPAIEAGSTSGTGDGAASDEDATADASIQNPTADAGSGLCNDAPASQITSCDSGIGEGDALGSSAALCLLNGSFELGRLGWVECGTTRTVVEPSRCTLPAAQGFQYLGVPMTSIPRIGATASVSTFLLRPLVAGARYPFTIDAGIAVRTLVPPLPVSTGASVLLEIWGGKNPCGMDERLWSMTISKQDAWELETGVLTPSQSLSYLVLVVSLATSLPTPQTSYVILDDLAGSVPCILSDH